MVYVYVVVVLLVIAIFDILQRSHSILRNFPIIGHFRYLLESFGPELRQYIVTSNNEERPFNRDQRSWIYASAKKENDHFGFGSDNDLERTPNYFIIKQAAFPLSEALPGEPNYDETYQIPCGKILGGYRKRKKAFRPASIVNISGMSYGSLSSNAVEALNKGSKLANCLHNTGEGGITRFHDHGADLVWQIGTGYFGCRDKDGKFDKQKFLDKVQRYNVKAIEIKLSQGAKPGLGGVLPKSKITREIAEIRGIPMTQDCISPAAHSAFEDVDSMLDFVEDLAESSGLPVGIKAAVGYTTFWEELADYMTKDKRGVDFITIDGGEGGTGAAPLVFADHVGLPFKMAMARVYREFAQRKVSDNLVFIGSGKLGFPQETLFAFALGCDAVNIGREAMVAIGCIQAMRCQTNHCPTGVATQSKWLMRGLDPTLKSVRLANYLTVLRKEILRLSRACGVVHPTLITADYMELINDRFGGKSVLDVFDYKPNWGVPSDADKELITKLMVDLHTKTRPAKAPKIKDTPAVEHRAHDTAVTPDNKG